MSEAKVIAQLQGLEARLSTLVGMLTNQINATENRLLCELALLRAAIADQPARAANDFNRFEKILRGDRAKDTQLALLLARGLAAIVHRGARADRQNVSPVVAPQTVVSLAQQIARFRAIAPINVDAWQRAFDAGSRGYKETSVGNFSHVGHVGANYFRMFVNIHGRGRILDVGCGQLHLPEYLRDWPPDQIAGIDPLPPFQTHSFPYAQTFAENIPWPDGSFETVIVGTSLDHFYLLDAALAEIKRVLKPGGRLLLWTTLLQQSPPYDPYTQQIEQPDELHLFHPGKNWFPQLFQKDYETLETIETVASAELVAFERRSGSEVAYVGGDPDPQDGD